MLENIDKSFHFPIVFIVLEAKKPIFGNKSWKNRFKVDRAITTKKEINRAEYAEKFDFKFLKIDADKPKIKNKTIVKSTLS